MRHFKIEVDLKEFLAKIEQRLERIEQTLQKDLTELKVGQARLEEKVDGLSKHLENQ